MILSRRHEFAFIHIPKNGGTTVRETLEKFHDFPEKFNKLKPLEGYGEIYHHHVPLDILAERFPEAYDFVRTRPAFALLRDPHERFVSSFAQTVRSDLGGRPELLDREGILETCRAVMDHLRDHPRGDVRRFANFLPQHRFVLHDGQAVVDNLYMVADLAAMLAGIGALAGETLVPASARNVSVRIRPSMPAGLLLAGNRLLRRFLPSRVYRAVKRRVATRVGEKDTVTPGIILDDADVQAFIQDFYREDFRLIETLGGDAPGARVAWAGMS